MVEITFGINVVNIVTSGLYDNSLDALREYIQNSTDSIDDAVKAGILTEGDGKVTIDLDKTNRKITIEDNGIGVSAARDFERVMSSIGNSDKSLKTDRGFRGIGRLGGLAYCKTLIFSTKVAGEKKISTLTINAERLREEFWSGKKRSAESVLMENMRFYTLDAAPETPEHFFRVELIDIVDTNEDLLNVEKVRDYLSFVAPVTYSSQFSFQNQIYQYAASLGFKITEYKIEVNGEQLVKNYKIDLKTKSGSDKIFGIEFREVRDADENLIAWFWFGLSTFRGVLSEKGDSDSNKMRGLRLRLGNIQIGNAETLRLLFDEPRGTKYFIGEVHVVDKNLRPNSKRDDFEESKYYNALKSALKESFKELYEVYRAASDVRGFQKDINEPAAAEREFNEQSAPYKKSHKAEHEFEMTKLKKDAAKATDKLDDLRQKAEVASETAKHKVILHMIENQPTDEPTPPKPTPLDDKQQLRPVPPPPRKRFPPSNWTNKQRDVYWAIESIVLDNKKLSGKELLAKIKEELAK